MELAALDLWLLNRTSAYDWRYSPDQPRDDHGRFGEGDSGDPGGGGGIGSDITESLDAGAILDSSGPGRAGRETALRDVLAKQGFDGPPQVGSPAAVDAVVQAGGRELFRGTSPEAADQLRNGEYPIASISAHGMGIYTDTNQETAAYYGDHVVRMALSPNARTTTEEDLRAEAQARSPNWDDGQHVLYMDHGTLAAALGFDAFSYGPSSDPGNRAYVILNRTALTVQE